MDRSILDRLQLETIADPGTRHVVQELLNPSQAQGRF